MTGETPDTPNLHRHWGTFLQTVRWAHFVTLTTTDIVSVDRLRRDFVNRYIRRLGRDAQRGVGWFYAIEHHADGERAHVHALITNTETLTIAGLERSWILGNCRALIYDPRRGASHYVSKHLGRNPELYDLSRRHLPRRVLNVDAQEAA